MQKALKFSCIQVNLKIGGIFPWFKELKLESAQLTGLCVLCDKRKERF